MMNPEELLNKRNKIQENISLKQESRDMKNDLRQQTNATNETFLNTNQNNNFLRNNIGKLVKVDFLIGDNNIVNKIGFLDNVGTDYLILRSLEGDSLIYAETKSIKFITVFTQYAGMSNIQNMNNGFNNFNQRYY